MFHKYAPKHAETDLQKIFEKLVTGSTTGLNTHVACTYVRHMDALQRPHSG